MKFPPQTNSGFTVVEAFVAIIVLGIFLSAAAGSAQQNLRLSRKLKADTTAINLAQEGLEFIRYKRDTNRMAGASGGWLESVVGSPKICDHLHGCTAELDKNTGALTFNRCVPGPDCKKLFFDPTTKIYSYDASGVPTDYRRTIHVNELPGGTEARVEVIMQWDNDNRSYTVDEILNDWQ